jgi:hypothetical protein
MFHLVVPNDLATLGTAPLMGNTDNERLLANPASSKGRLKGSWRRRFTMVYFLPETSALGGATSGLVIENDEHGAANLKSEIRDIRLD